MEAAKIGLGLKSIDKILALVNETTEGETVDESNLYDFLQFSTAAGTKDFVNGIAAIASEGGESLRNYYSSIEEPVISNLIRSWQRNENMSTEAYIAFNETDVKNSPSSSLRRIFSLMRERMYMNDNAVAFFTEKNQLGRFSENTDGTREWLELSRRIKGDRFYSSVLDYSPYLDSGALTVEDILNAEEKFSAEISAKLLNMDLSKYDISLTHEAINSLSRRAIRKGVLEARNSVFTNEEIHKKFFEEYGITFYDFLLERVKELIPVTDRLKSHDLILSSVGKYFFKLESPGAFSTASMSFYQHYTQGSGGSRLVLSAYEVFIENLKKSNSETIAKWLALNTGDPEEQFSSLPKDWLIKMVTTLI